VACTGDRVVLQDFEQLPFPFDYLMQISPSIPLLHPSFPFPPPPSRSPIIPTLQNPPNRNPHQNRHPSTSSLRHRPTLKRRRSRRPSSRTRPPSRAVRAGGGVGGLAAAEGEVGAGQARGVGSVDDDGAVAEEGGGAGGGGEVEVEETVGGCLEMGLGGGRGKGERGGGIYQAVKGLIMILPCLPAKSPTWHVCGMVGSQGGFSPRM